MMAPRLAAAALAACIVNVAAVADEYVTYEMLDVAVGTAPGCRTLALVSLPSAWHSGDGAAVVVTRERTQEAARDQLVAMLIEQRTAVVEIGPVTCAAAVAGDAGIVASARGALAAVTRTMGAGPVVAVSYGRGGAAVIDALRAAPAGGAAAEGQGFVAAVALGDGPATFARGADMARRNQVPLRLAALCDALDEWAGAMGATPARLAPAAAAETCRVTMVGEAPARRVLRP